MVVVTLLFAVSVLKAQERILATNPTVITGHLIKVTLPLRDFRLPANYNPRIVRDLDGIIGKDEDLEEGPKDKKFPTTQHFSEDPVLQKNYPNNPHHANIEARAIVQNFNGIGYQPLNPPDPSMCVGPNNVIQMINGASGALFKVYNKTGGQVVAQTTLGAITGKGGLGDPVCLYDQGADRYVLTEFADKTSTVNEGLIIAVSQTSDPAGAWYVYFFSTGTTFPDYPKYSIWNDAYYATTNDFANGSSYAGSSVYAFDRAKILAGNQTATMQKFTLGSTNKHFSMAPVNWQGSTAPPAGSGGLIAYMNDDTWSGSATDSIGLFEFKVNFTTPSSSVVLQKSSLAVTAATTDICTTTRGQCINQPGTTTKVEDLDSRVMNQPIYRNFGGYEGIVMTYVVNKGSSIAAPRWYELRKTGTAWSVYQQSTYSPDNTHRWMPTICYDAAGNIGLVYNVSASTLVYPGVRYTGRKSCDALNTMTYSEDVIIAGTAANGSTRYGDYNQLACDPDGVRFWVTAEYNAASTWSTRIASFTLDNCNSCGDPAGLVSSNILTTSATVSWTAVTNAVSYDVDYQLTGATTWINAATATTATSVNLSSLTLNTSYTWRVRANCTAGSSNYISSSFTTAAACGTVSSLTASSITVSSATVSWAAVTSAVSYDVDYQTNGATAWTNAATGTTSFTAALSGLISGTVYNYRVRANCTSGAGNYTQASFTTLVPCGTVSGLTSSSITSSGATVAWTALSGANNYYADYQLTGATTWTNIATATTATSVSISGLTASTGYTWRVRGNCTSGAGAYATSSFTTSSTTANCVTAFEPNETLSAAIAITSGVTNSAAISTSTDIDYYKITTTATSNIVYNLVGPSGVDYDLYIYNSAGTQIGSSLGTTATETVSLSSQATGTYYIKIIGYSGANSATCYTIKATATTVTSCISAYDVSANGTTSGAAVIPFNTNITGLISPSGDIDNYKFAITTGGTITITLTTLPGDYDLKLLNSAGTQVGISQNGSTTSESIGYTAAAGTYYAQVYGYNGANSSTSCYTLKVALGTASKPDISVTTGKGVIKVYPNPVTNILNVSVLGEITNKSVLRILDVKGVSVMEQRMIINPQSINISKLSKGEYILEVINGDNIITSKFVKQ